MENQNNTTNELQTPAVPVVSSPDTPVAAAPAKISAKEGFQIRMQEIKQKFGLDDPQKKKRILIILGAMLGIIVVLSVAYALIPKQVAPPLATIAPSPESSLAPEGVPSEFADDPEVLRIMDSINSFKQKESGTVLREDDLRIPTVDWNVKF